MTDPVTAGIVASTILQLAFNEFIKSGAGEAAKKLTGAALDQANHLRQTIWDRSKGNSKAEKALTEVEQGSEAALIKLEVYLDDVMQEDADFAAQVRTMAEQILTYQDNSTVSMNQQNINQGRDQYIINQPGQIGKIGGS